MKKFVFYGTVRPENFDISFVTPLLTIDASSHLGKQMLIKMVGTVQNSQVKVEVDIEGDFSDLQAIRDAINDILSRFTDSFGFMGGYWSEIEFTLSHDIINGKKYNLSPWVKGLIDDKSNKPVQSGLDLALLVTNVKYNALRLALRDFRHAIKYQNDTAVYCYRAIESIMQYFNKSANPHEDRKEAWSKLNSSLNISKDWIQFVSNFALDPRHGRPRNIGGSERNEVMNRTWKTIDRFIAYLKENEKPLNKVTYPEL